MNLSKLKELKQESDLLAKQQDILFEQVKELYVDVSLTKEQIDWLFDWFYNDADLFHVSKMAKLPLMSDAAVTRIG